MAEFTNPLERWNSRFATNDYLFGEEPNQFLQDQQPYLQSGNVLSIADGEGRNSVWLAALGLKVDAFDFSENAIQKAKLLAQKKQVSVNFNCTSWQDFLWQEAKYDYVVGIFFQFVNPEKRLQLFQKMVQTLKVGGLIILQGYGKDQLRFKTGGPGELDHLYDEELLTKLLPNFEFMVLKTYEAEIVEGTGHAGMSSLVGVVARKLA
jgi:cyclopropane fatty-acyl-phospholipid synthase-like methyltransferase